MGAPRIERAGEPDDPREAAEPALGEVKRRAGVRLTPRRRFLSGDHHHAARPRDADRVGGNTRQIDEDLDRL